MEIQEILSRCDHTQLSPTATWQQIQSLCQEGIAYGTASVCIPACYVACAKAYVGKRIPICTVIGFPNGYSTTAAKVFETSEAVRNGADEIDMVINLGWLKDGALDLVRQEIAAVRSACAGRILKVIVETCLLTDAEKTAMCRIVSEAGAEYIKTSTGFSSGGATPHDVALLAANVPPGLKIKAAGGIKTLEDAAQLISLGADRLGTSRIVRLVQSAEQK